MTEYCEQSPLTSWKSTRNKKQYIALRSMDMPKNWTGVFRSQAETVGLPMTNEHNIGWGVTARQLLRLRTNRYRFGSCRFPGCTCTENFSSISFYTPSNFLDGVIFFFQYRFAPLSKRLGIGVKRQAMLNIVSILRYLPSQSST